MFADAEGNGLTGAIQVASDNERGVHIQGIQVKAPLAFMGKVEVHNLFLNFNGERNGDAKATCNAESPGLRWDGGAEKIVLPTPDKLTHRERRPRLRRRRVHLRQGHAELGRRRASRSAPASACRRSRSRSARATR